MRNAILLIAIIVGGCQVSINETQTEEATPLYDYQIDDRLTELNIQLPQASQPVANYVNGVHTGNLIFLAGKGPKKSDGTYITGIIGDNLTQEEGYAAARLTAINQLAVLKEMLGDLNRISRIVKVTGMVNATPGFGNQPEVVNGFSDLLVEVFGERGKHARAAVGMGSLPRNICVEIEMVVEVDGE